MSFIISTLGSAKVPSPVSLSKKMGDMIANYVSDDELIIYGINAQPGKTYTPKREELVEKAGPREYIYFDPSKVHAGIVTCGGLCPGLNDVIRAIVMTLWYQYGVRKISGIRFGYRGFIPDYGLPVVELNPDVVSDIHRMGGTILGSSRGNGERTSDIVDSIERMNLTILFTIGGDGTQKGALKIAEEIERRCLKTAVVGVPKTIDNDLSFIEKSFGFETAVSKAVEAVSGAHVEAHDAVNGIAVVKLMGRESGFIAAHTALASNDVNYVLVPEIPFDLDGEKGLLANLKKRLERRKHALIVVAEGAGQELFPDSEVERDASGNRKLGDIGLLLKQRISSYFKEQNIEINLKYLDPSYIIRSTESNPSDSVYCTRLGTNAVHAAMAGKTKMLISLIHNTYVHVPMKLAVSQRNRIDPESPLWRDVVHATGQPALMKNMEV
ncbi:MAG TPA: ATP-dependent 6-phosphofructokinase [Chitinispirillaceae bacterium]|jgi:6-phosphofructokinase 1|nr:ATP-dependent 6-phosphofructokinase [Chitinispirillaceae bacterium]